MEKIKELMTAGLPAPEAIKFALGCPVSAWADRHSIPRSTATNVINGVQRSTDAVVAALAADLGGTENEWREVLWQAMKPAHMVA
jgi:hypothetical protein